MIQTYKSNLANFLHWAEHTPSNVFLKQPYGNQYTDYSYEESAIQVKKIASYFKKTLFTKHYSNLFDFKFCTIIDYHFNFILQGLICFDIFGIQQNCTFVAFIC